MNIEKLKNILRDIEKLKIGIIGDFCLDVYWTINMQGSEISIETGLATHPVEQHSYSLGGAGNVAANLCALGVKEIYAFAVLGQDMFGSQMLDLFKAKNISEL